MIRPAARGLNPEIGQPLGVDNTTWARERWGEKTVMGGRWEHGIGHVVGGHDWLRVEPDE